MYSIIISLTLSPYLNSEDFVYFIYLIWAVFFLMYPPLQYLFTRHTLALFCIDWPMLGLSLCDVSATRISDPSSKSACLHQQKCLRKQSWRHTSHNMKLATKKNASVTSANIPPFHPCLPTNRNHDPMTCAATPRWASASSPPHAAASAPLSRWALDEGWSFTIQIEEDTMIYIYIYMIIHLYTICS